MIIKYRQPIFNNGNFTGWHYWGYTTNDIEFFTSPLTSNDGKIRESGQFTGLFDSDKKEIYHGDILALEGDKLGYVEWNKEAASWWVNQDPVNGYGSLGYQLISGLGHPKKALIIGNLQENPELLNLHG